MKRLSMFVFAALSVLSVNALAQDEAPPADGAAATETAPADGAMAPAATESAGEVTASAGAGAATPVAWVDRAINSQTGRIEAGVSIGLPKGPDDTGELGIGNWVGATLNASYGVSDAITAGVALPMALIKLDGAEALGGVHANVLYSLMPMLSARVNVGFAHAGAGVPSTFASGMYADADGMKLAFGVGVAFKKVLMPQLALTADPGVYFQQDMGMSDSGEVEMLQVASIPLGVHYQAMPNMVASLNTGINSAHAFKFGSDDGGTVPLMVGATYTVMNNQLDVGLNVGLGNVTPPSGGSAGDTLAIGLNATWRNL